jgi:hypothetical protein
MVTETTDSKTAIKKLQQKSSVVYLLVSLAITILSNVIIFILNSKTGLLRATGVMWLPSMLFATNYIIHWILLKVSEKRPQKFITTFMAITTFKLFGYLSVIVTYILVAGKQHAMGFALTFIALYLVYTATEVISILNYLRRYDSLKARQ